MAADDVDAAEDGAGGRVGSVDPTVAAEGAASGWLETKTCSSASDCLNGLQKRLRVSSGLEVSLACTHLSCGVAVEKVPDWELAMVRVCDVRGCGRCKMWVVVVQCGKSRAEQGSA